MTTIFDIIKVQAERKKAEYQAQHEAMRLQRRELLHQMALEADIALDGRRNKQKQEVQNV